MSGLTLAIQLKKNFISSYLRNFREGVLSLLFPRHCPLCRQSLKSDHKQYLCPTCWREIQLIKAPVCSQCGKPSAISRCFLCQKKSFYFQSARAVGKYSGALKKSIHLFKFGKKAYLAKPLGELMADVMQENSNFQNADLIIPVPLDNKRYREREFNQADLLARVLSRRFRIPLSVKILRKTSSAPPQSRLKKQARAKSVRGIFKVKNPEKIKEKSILLIDDVFTTGSTANECARVLSRSGAKEINILTVARGN